jgi:hypothetical protein
MTEIEKALEYADGIECETAYSVTLAAAYRAEKNEAEVLRDTLRVFIANTNEQRILKLKEKTRADDLEAENARLREELEPLIKILDPEPFGTLSGMGSLDKRLEWYDKMRPLRESARKALTPSTPSHAGEIDPTHADYGCFKTRNEFPS